MALIEVRIIDQCVAQGVLYAREFGGLLHNRSFGAALVSSTFSDCAPTKQQSRVVESEPASINLPNHAIQNFFSQEITMSNSDTHTWPDLAIALYDQLTQRNAEIAYHFDDLEVAIPGSTGADSERAQWKLNGGIRVTTRSGAAS